MVTTLTTPKIRNREFTMGEVHIWLASQDAPTLKFRRLLDEDEANRAERFKFERDSNRFIVRRGILRMLSGCYLGIEPENVRFYYGENGKPKIVGEFNGDELLFSLSHSGGIAIYAFTHHREIGVDIEQIRDITDMTHLAERFFSNQEKTILYELPESQKKEGFFNCWTRKEAFLKATGDGLSYPLERVDVTIAPQEPAKLLAIGGDPEAASIWSMQDLKPALNFAGAFALKGQINNVQTRRWVN
jgi:4'-phosphopantetheinyl transferase